MSNYPAGVTGREFAIAGYDSEEDAERECGKYGTVKVFTREAAREVERIKVLLAEIADGRKPATLAATLVVSLDYLLKYRINTVDIEECPFVGEVAIGWYDGQGDWECPLCGHEHREPAPEADPDDWYDSRSDRD